MNRAKNFCG